jgi:hypothetical protein
MHLVERPRVALLLAAVVNLLEKLRRHAVALLCRCCFTCMCMIVIYIYIYAESRK